MHKPLDNSYPVDKKIYAGEYPGDKVESMAKSKIQKMIDFGIRHFIDLTEENELKPYSHLLPENVTYTRFPIKDCHAPQRMEDVTRLIDYIKELKTNDDGYIYIHCWGGVGRTGTIVGCYLSEFTEEFGTAIDSLRKRFTEMPKSAYRVTPETPEQENFIRQYIEKKKEDRVKRRDALKDSIRGSLIGGAVGDALGYAVEFIKRHEILEKYGENGITCFETDNNGKALISDDTQMTLFTANGLLMGVTRCAMRGIGSLPEFYVDGAYLDWYYTQTGKKSSWSHNDFHYTWLRDLPELAHRRAPGITCLTACESLLQHEKVKNNSKGCGGIMRVAPMALMAASYSQAFSNSFYHNNPMDLAEAGARIAKITHLHPLGYLPAALLTLFIYDILPLSPQESRLQLENIINKDLEIIMKLEGDKNAKEKEYLKWLTLKAIRMAKSDLSDADAISQLGEGWVAEETWAISLFCTLRHINNPEKAISAAVNHDGDSDSTGSVTGNMIGAIHGYEALKRLRPFCPQNRKLEDTLELHDIILALADDLHSGCIISEYDAIDTPEKQQWYDRYCQMKPAGL